MQFLPGCTYHIYNQGNNRDLIYFKREDYLLFIEKMRKAFMPHSSMLAWCLMPNHFHFLIRVNLDYEVQYEPNQKSRKLNPLNKDIGSMLSSYTQNINQRLKRSGSLFRKRTKVKSIDESKNNHNEYGINCFLYIHQNPLRAGLVDKMEAWEFSSFPDYAGFRKGTLCDKELAKDLFKFPGNEKEFYRFSKRTVPDEVIQKLF